MGEGRGQERGVCPKHRTSAEAERAWLGVKGGRSLEPGAGAARRCPPWVQLPRP